MENDMTEWIKCSERVPDNSRQVLVTASGLIGLTFWDKDYKCWWSNSDITDYIDLYAVGFEYNIECISEQITHWAELPEAPND